MPYFLLQMLVVPYLSNEYFEFMSHSAHKSQAWSQL